jgi:hypothetical protein
MRAEIHTAASERASIQAGGQAEKWSRRAAACAAEPHAFDQPAG